MKKFHLLVILSCTIFSACETLKLPAGTGITEAEAAQGIREALNQGVGRGIGFLNKPDGFFGNEAYKLFLPPDAKKIENTLRTIGMGNMVDKTILQINRAAEDAVGYAKPIFVDAIKEMTIMDAINIVRGTKYYADVVSAYNKLPTTFNKINPDLPSYVVGKSVDALFDQIAKEEANIRENPVARTTEILKKVFGSVIH